MFLVKAAGINDANTKGSIGEPKQNAYSGLQTCGTADGLTYVNIAKSRTPKLMIKQVFSELSEEYGDPGTRAILVRL